MKTPVAPQTTSTGDEAIRERRRQRELELVRRRAIATRLLLALNRSGKHIYEGTVSPGEKARRRARNKRARLSRRRNRERR